MSPGWLTKGSFAEPMPMPTDVVVALTDAGLAGLTDTAAVHGRGVSELFVARLDKQELAVLARVLEKVTVDSGFG